MSLHFHSLWITTKSPTTVMVTQFPVPPPSEPTLQVSLLEKSLKFLAVCRIPCEHYSPQGSRLSSVSSRSLLGPSLHFSSACTLLGRCDYICPRNSF